jgi:hypothetical protein
LTANVVHLGGGTVPLGPTQIHAQEHLGEVGRVHAARTGPDRDDRLARVVLPGQQRADLHLVDGLLQRADLLAHLGEDGRVGLGFGQFEHQRGIVQPGP